MCADEKENQNKTTFTLIRNLIQHISSTNFDLLEAYSSGSDMQSVCGLELDLDPHTCWHRGSSAKHGRNMFNLIRRHYTAVCTRPRYLLCPKEKTTLTDRIPSDSSS